MRWEIRTPRRIESNDPKSVWTMARSDWLQWNKALNRESAKKSATAAIDKLGIDHEHPSRNNGLMERRAK